MTTEVGAHRAPRGRVAEALVTVLAPVGAGALIVAALAIGSLVPTSETNIEHRERPFVAAGEVGDLRSTRDLDVTVTGVRGAGKIDGERRVHETTGVWILVKVRFEARTEARPFGYSAVRAADGRVFRRSQRIEQPLDGRFFQPGIPVTGELVFEVPKDAASSGLTVLIADSSFDQRMDLQVEIALPEVDAATVDRWAAGAAVTVAEDEVVS